MSGNDETPPSTAEESGSSELLPPEPPALDASGSPEAGRPPASSGAAASRVSPGQERIPPGEPPGAGEPETRSERSQASPTRRERMRAFWARHRTVFWMVHSVWALATGVFVVLLARERYAFVPWVVVFLGATWASTLFFGRPPASEVQTPGLGTELTSYLTRTLYQETLFFLLPFYAYSTVLGSPNMLFLLLLGGLAVVSCLDLIFDRWLNTKPVFGMLFFATVAFAALNLLLPMLFGVSPRWSVPVAAVVAVASALPLAWRSHLTASTNKLSSGATALALLALLLLVPSLIPPVPLRMQSADFGSDIDTATLTLEGIPQGRVARSRVSDRLVVVVGVFAPSNVPARVALEWKRDGSTIKTSRQVDILAHESVFRVWDGLRNENTPIEPGDYEVILRTEYGSVFGVAEITVTSE